MSIKALTRQGHAHSLEDDLESFIYIVLYAALRWLPVESPEATLDWWIIEFFGAPRRAWLGGAADQKASNVLTRRYTESLTSTESSHVVDWLKAAIDLHFEGYTYRAANPPREDGKAMRVMWEGILAKDLPTDDRRVNLIPDVKLREDNSLHATYTVATSSQDLYRHRNDATQQPSPPPPHRASYPAPQPSKGSDHERDRCLRKVVHDCPGPRT
jgi:hypothetical protein